MYGLFSFLVGIKKYREVVLNFNLFKFVELERFGILFV